MKKPGENGFIFDNDSLDFVALFGIDEKPMIYISMLFCSNSFFIESYSNKCTVSTCVVMSSTPFPLVQLHEVTMVQLCTAFQVANILP